jgi:Transport and Golgi organisation 2
MCTVSILRAPWADAGADDGPLWRVVCNRDEQRTRRPAVAPLAGGCAARRVVYPLDPDGRGTWIAATSAGLVFTLLNETEAEGASMPARPVSRGLIIPLLASAGSLEEVADRLDRLRPEAYRPFRLLVAGDAHVLEAVSGPSLALTRHPSLPRLLRTSSSHDPAATRRRRMALFDALVPVPSMAAQAGFHAHRWPGAPEASVLMARPDARTVSVTTVDVFARSIRLAYRPVPAGRADVTNLVRAA